jgi:2,4-dienoyl-CoA reductase-like NADH-dependent reductase (Old Yellow Enzyme family)
LRRFATIAHQHGAAAIIQSQHVGAKQRCRDDEWATPRRFWKAILERVRAGLGPHAILGARIPSDDLQPMARGGLGRERLKEMACELVATGLMTA